MANKDKQTVLQCGLCEAIDPSGVIEMGETMRIVRNRVPYDIFDGLSTTGEHYLIIPKRHVALFEQFSDVEKLEEMNLIAKYEKIGFSVYARSHTNVYRSQSHQHTHLIKLTDKTPKFLLAIAKPYLLLFK